MELLDIVDENNNLIGKAEERSIVHEKVYGIDMLELG